MTESFKYVPLMALIGWLATGCATTPTTPSVGESLRFRSGGSGRTTLGERIETDPSNQAAGAGLHIATVNGHPIARRRVVDLLLRSGGTAVLEQLIVLDEAERAAASRGLHVTDRDVQREYDDALRALTDPLGEIAHGPIDYAAAERALNEVLANRNVSAEEFVIGMRRRAYLRKLVESESVFSEADFEAEYGRLYGPRVQLRHIQLTSSRVAIRLKGQLDAGADFAELAREHSANLVTAEAGGLLEPFSIENEAVPAPIRRVARSLQPGEVSSPVPVGEWVHLLKFEHSIPGGEEPLGDVREKLRQSLLARNVEPAMRKKYEDLFAAARIEIHDPVLKRAFENVHSAGKGGSTKGKSR